MAGLFRRRLDEGQRNELVAYVRHFQYLLMSQQLTMEIYNDAMQLASEYIVPGNDILVQGTGEIRRPEAVVAYLIPAVQEKLGILDALIVRHGAILPGDDLGVRLTCELATGLLEATRARAQLQLDCWSAWAQDPSLDLSTTMSSLDTQEQAWTSKTLKSLDDLISRAGLDRAALLEVNRQATNLIRATARGLPPLRHCPLISLPL